MRYLISIAVILSFVACKKAEDRSCFKSIGNDTTKEIALDSFDKLYMGPHLKYVLVQDTVEKVVLTGGENLLNFVETDVSDGTLSVRNINKCNFLRSYSKLVTVEIHLVDVINITFEGTHEVICRNTINSTYLTLVIRDGAGEFNLDLNANSLNAVVTHGWGNFNISGSVDYLNMNIRSNGFGSTYDLIVKDSINIACSTTEPVKINSDSCQLRAQTLSSGDIWFVGTPEFIEFNTYGTGELLDKN
jgi:Putative auto-transporter adhesin, head GIN domain